MPADLIKAPSVLSIFYTGTLHVVVTNEEYDFVTGYTL